jgi:hypothetical protein
MLEHSAGASGVFARHGVVVTPQTLWERVCWAGARAAECRRACLSSLGLPNAEVVPDFVVRQRLYRCVFGRPFSAIANRLAMRDRTVPSGSFCDCQKSSGMLADHPLSACSAAPCCIAGSMSDGVA